MIKEANEKDLQLDVLRKDLQAALNRQGILYKTRFSYILRLCFIFMFKFKVYFTATYNDYQDLGNHGWFSPEDSEMEDLHEDITGLFGEPQNRAGNLH